MLAPKHEKNTPYRLVEYLYINIHASPKMREVLYCLQMIFLHIYEFLHPQIFELYVENTTFYHIE